VLGFSHLFLQSSGIVGVGEAWVLSQSIIAVVLFTWQRLKPTKSVTPVAVDVDRVRSLEVD
jgi:hypothetical protein